MPRPRLLCVDDDSGIRELYHALFSSHGYEVVCAETPGQALTELRSQTAPFVAVISDYEMPGMNGLQLAAIVKRSHPGLPFILISGSPRDLAEASAMVDATMEKGCGIRELVDGVETVLAARVPVVTARSGYLSLGSALAGAASLAFLLSRLWP